MTRHPASRNGYRSDSAPFRHAFSPVTSSALSPLRKQGSRILDSRLRGNDPPPRFTERLPVRQRAGPLRGQSGDILCSVTPRGSGGPGSWIPACAGMTRHPASRNGYRSDSTPFRHAVSPATSSALSPPQNRGGSRILDSRLRGNDAPPRFTERLPARQRAVPSRVQSGDILCVVTPAEAGVQDPGFPPARERRATPLH
jgi:hypothetical protein